MSVRGDATGGGAQSLLDEPDELDELVELGADADVELDESTTTARRRRSTSRCAELSD